MARRPTLNSRFFAPVMISLILLAFLAGCKKTPFVTRNEDDASPSLEEAHSTPLEHFNAKLEKSFSDTERSILENDLLALYGYQFPKLPDLSIFSYVFGGNSSSDVIQYLDERIQYVYPPSAHPLVNHDSFGDFQESNGVIIRAQNLSSMLLFEQWVRPHSIVSIQFNGEGIIPHSTRTGVVQLNQDYMDSISEKNRSSVYRVAILVHEARHSDCKTPFDAEDIERVRAGKRIKTLDCGYSHEICPAMLPMSDGKLVPHPYAGYAACDPMPWGSYSVQGVLTMEIAKSCTTCTEAERQEAKMISIDSFVRYPKAKLMLTGALGTPDMTSH